MRPARTDRVDAGAPCVCLRGRAHRPGAERSVRARRRRRRRAPRARDLRRAGRSDPRCKNRRVRLVLIGLVAGFFSALFGVGGGIVIVPLLLFCGWDSRVATATSLAAIGITAVSGVIAYAIHGDVNVGYAALVGLPAAVSVAGATALQQRLQTRTIELLFSAFILAVAVWLFVK